MGYESRTAGYEPISASTIGKQYAPMSFEISLHDN
ncbi:hypothetical protein GGR33_002720 [Methylobacterium brachythecii]|uniref:Uncharacterized protein n=1 Tax=Methylobacterium brachythecii TaxID=1176177 RepID=A0A7W6AH33_9HYPH|nr:hypothetical protein [Methylobacterium brachythecii]